MVGAVLHIHDNFTVHFSCRSNLDRPPLTAKPTMVKLKPAESYWTSLHAEIETHLKQAIPMKEPMHHLFFAAPRTTAPALCIAACEVVGGQRDQAMAAASALLLMPAAAYTHEHLPLTGRPIPRPKTDHVCRPNIELLTGDGMIPFGFEMLAKSGQPGQIDSERVPRVIIEISRAMGSQGMIDGQYRKILGLQSDGNDSCHVESMKQAIEKSEGSIHACGAMLGGGK